MEFRRKGGEKPLALEGGSSGFFGKTLNHKRPPLEEFVFRIDYKSFLSLSEKVPGLGWKKMKAGSLQDVLVKISGGGSELGQNMQSFQRYLYEHGMTGVINFADLALYIAEILPKPGAIAPRIHKKNGGIYFVLAGSGRMRIAKPASGPGAQEGGMEIQLSEGIVVGVAEGGAVSIEKTSFRKLIVAFISGAS